MLFDNKQKYQCCLLHCGGSFRIMDVQDGLVAAYLKLLRRDVERLEKG